MPARPGYEAAIGYFLQTGCIWNGGDPPLVDDELYVSMVDDLRKPTGELLDTWEVRVPTSLVRLQPDASLPAREPCPTMGASDDETGGETAEQDGATTDGRCWLLEWLRKLFGGKH